MIARFLSAALLVPFLACNVAAQGLPDLGDVSSATLSESQERTIGNRIMRDLRLDPAARRVWRGNAEVSLSAKEFQLLETFMRHPGEVLSRYQLLEHAWDYDYENRSNIVDVYVRYLRDKIDRPFGRSSLETVRGAGYRLDDRVPALAA